MLSDYDGASTSETQDETEKLTSEQQDTDEGGDGVSSEGEKASAAGTTEVSSNNFSIGYCKTNSFHI